MEYVPLASIRIAPNRQRKKFESQSIVELAHSIAEVGLMHALVLTHDNRLVAGERRLRAIEHLYGRNRLFSFNGTPVPAGQAPIVRLEELDPITLRQAELDENIRREQLTWQEQTSALAEIQRLRRAQNPTQTTRDTARELAPVTGRSMRTLENQIARATVIDDFLDDPQVARARNEAEAFSIVARKLERDFREQLLHTAPKSNHTLINNTFEDFVLHHRASMPPFDCIIADPPYGVEAHEFGDAAREQHVYDDAPEAALELCEQIITDSYSIAAQHAHMYMFCAIDLFIELRTIAERCGWKPWRVPIIWHKGTSSHAPWGNQGMWRSYECILALVKGNKGYNILAQDMISLPNLRDREHAAQKPVALYVELLRRSALAGDTVLDPCCGSGTIFMAADELKINAWGIEPNKDYVAMAQAKLEEVPE